MPITIAPAVLVATKESTEDGWKITAKATPVSSDWIGAVEISRKTNAVNYETPDLYRTADAACMAAYVLGRKALAEAVRNGDPHVYESIIELSLIAGIRLRSQVLLALATRKMPACEPGEKVLLKKVADEPDYFEALEFHLASLAARK
ncbi:MAG: hypothetical protein ACREUW_15300 [Burkholderiales bacterium]